jgi:hypothetical protein
MKYSYVGDSCSRNVLVSNSPTGIEILLVVGRVQRGNRQTKPSAGWNSPSQPIELKGKLYQPVHLHQFLLLLC